MQRLHTELINTKSFKKPRRNIRKKLIYFLEWKGGRKLKPCDPCLANSDSGSRQSTSMRTETDKLERTKTFYGKGNFSEISSWYYKLSHSV